jgi:hypothetical protein
MTRDELIESALADYHAAVNHMQEHVAVQRLLALGQDGGDPDAKPCPEPECVALREAMLALLD